MKMLYRIVPRRAAILTRYVVILLALSTSGFLEGCSQEGNSSDTTAPVAVRVTRPQIRNMSRHVTYTGIVRAAKEVTLVSRVQGTVTSLRLGEGEFMRAGDTLVTLAVPDLEAVVARLKAEFDYWDERYSEDVRLEADGAIAREQVDASKKAYASTKAALEEANSRLAKATEIASFDGYVLRHYVDVGQAVMPGQPLALIGSEKLELHSEVVQEDLRSNIRSGSVAIVHDREGPGWISQVAKVAPVTDGKSGTFTVTVTLDREHGRQYRIGESVALDFVAESEEKTLSVPVSAIMNENTEPSIYLIRDGRAFMTPVTLGIRQSDQIAVKFDWNGTDSVALSNISSLSDGALVYPVYEEMQ